VTRARMRKRFPLRRRTCPRGFPPSRPWRKKQCHTHMVQQDEAWQAFQTERTNACRPLGEGSEIQTGRTNACPPVGEGSERTQRPPGAGSGKLGPTRGGGPVKECLLPSSVRMAELQVCPRTYQRHAAVSFIHAIHFIVFGGQAGHKTVHYVY
jgi:hypothetical protein